MSDSANTSEADATRVDHGGQSSHGSPRFYVAIWAALVCLTALTVTAASWDLGWIAILVVLAIAATKSILVLLGFMHLWWEDKLVIQLLIPIVLVTLTIFIGLTYTDILYR
ncbi:MAG TPA: cytochrome C oxidase subunit IV family protein [Rectinemataceae bacterium]|nr:cytochrome C oxidase subunit IV family protein [Rectinemataceae bacterium]